MVNFRALRQIWTVIRFWITVHICFKRKKLCLVARLCCIFKTKVVISQLILFILLKLPAVSRAEKYFACYAVRLEPKSGLEPYRAADEYSHLRRRKNLISIIRIMHSIQTKCIVIYIVWVFEECLIFSIQPSFRIIQSLCWQS